MCLLVHLPKGASWSQDNHDAASFRNSDGVGLAWVEKDHVEVRHFLDPTMKEDEEIFDLITSLKKKDVMLHYRFATHGTRNLENTHPIKIADEIYLAHNGVMHNIAPISSRWYGDMSTASDPSDTAILAQALKVAHEAGYDILNPDAPVWKMLEIMDITVGQRLMLISPKGIINIHPELGDWTKQGFWASNSNWTPMVHNSYRAPATTDASKSYHHAGTAISTVEILDEDDDSFPLTRYGTDPLPPWEGRPRNFYLVQSSQRDILEGTILCEDCATTFQLDVADPGVLRIEESDDYKGAAGVCDACEGEAHMEVVE